MERLICPAVVTILLCLLSCNGQRKDSCTLNFAVSDKELEAALNHAAQDDSSPTTDISIDDVITGIIGFEQIGTGNTFSVFPHLPEGMEYIGVDNLRIGNSRVGIRHEGNRCTTITYPDGIRDLSCLVYFSGVHERISIDGTVFSALHDEFRGKDVSYIKVTLPVHSKVRICVLNE